MWNQEAIAEQWLERIWRTYPPQTARFLAAEQDAFRNPIGQTLREGLAILLDELLLGMEPSRVNAALDSIVQIRAVQDLPPSRALEFLPELKSILSKFAPLSDLDLLYARIDTLVLRALDLYVKYRERTFEARSNEARRRVYVLERRFVAAEPEWHERGVR